MKDIDRFEVIRSRIFFIYHVESFSNTIIERLHFFLFINIIVLISFYLSNEFFREFTIILFCDLRGFQNASLPFFTVVWSAYGMANLMDYKSGGRITEVDMLTLNIAIPRTGPSMIKCKIPRLPARKISLTYLLIQFCHRFIHDVSPD